MNCSLRLPATVTANLAGREECLQKKISQFNSENDVSLISKLHEHGRAGTVQGTSASNRTNPSGSTPPRSRTVCQPVFTAPNVPINPQATAVPCSILEASELQAKKLPSCTCDSQSHRFERPLNCYMIYALVLEHSFVCQDTCSVRASSLRQGSGGGHRPAIVRVSSQHDR